MSARTLSEASRHGFTLIEILVVISIISLLSSISVGAILIAKEKARRAVAATFIAGLNSALEHYCEDTGRYPGAEVKDGENGSDDHEHTLRCRVDPPTAEAGPHLPYHDPQSPE